MDLSMSQFLVGKEKFKKPDRLATNTYVVMIHRFLDALLDLESEFPTIKSAESCRQTIMTLLTRARTLDNVEASLGNPLWKG